MQNKSKALLAFYAAEDDHAAEAEYNGGISVIPSVGQHACMHFDICLTAVSGSSVTYTTHTAVLDYVHTRTRMEKELPDCTPSFAFYQVDETFRFVAARRLDTRTLRLQHLPDGSLVAKHSETAAVCGVAMLPFAVSMLFSNMLSFPAVFQSPPELSLHPLHTVFLEVLRVA